MLNVVAGEPEYREMIRPYSIAVDSHGRAIITDPGAKGVHIFDLEQHKYKFIQRADKEHDPMLSPQCVAVDDQDNFYVTDSESGKIFVFDDNGKFKQVLGSLKGGEGYFKRPTGIAVDSVAQKIYVTDTLRDEIFVLDMQGQVMSTIGKHGTGKGEFRFPTELRLDDRSLMVVDAMNFRVQVVDRNGELPRRRSGKLEIPSARRSGPRALPWTQKGICTLWTGYGAWCRFSIARAGCSTTLGGKAEAESFSCPQACSSIITTASSSWIRLTGGCRCFTITDCRSKREERHVE